MLGRAHIAIGVALGLAAARAVAGDTTAYWIIPAAVIVSGVSAGLPDVLDSENAAGRAPLGISWSGIQRDARRKNKSLVSLIALAPRILLAAVVDVIAKLLPHRGLTHWLSTWFLLSLLFFVVALWAGWPLIIPLGFSAGYVSHLLADGMTNSGVPFFGPFYNERLHLLPRGFRFRFDSPVQWLVVFAIWGGALLLWYPQIDQIARLAGDRL